MTDTTLKYKVQTLDNEVLLPEGTLISSETMEALIASRGRASFELRPMLEHGTLASDIKSLLGLFPYRRIFPTEEYVYGVVGDMRSVVLPVPILQAMDYFKEQDFYTYRHILMVFALSTLLARDLVLDERDRITLIASGPTHDIGKICVPLEVLRKDRPLTKAELEILRNHAAAGYVLLSYYLGDAGSLSARVARDHHERCDGTGYPRGSKLEDTMVEVIAACDVYDALIAPRPYRPMPYDNRTALEEMTDMADRGALSIDTVHAIVSHNRRTVAPYCESMFSHTRRGTPPPGNVHGIIVGEGGASPRYR